jgi:hypothetical protein
MMMFPIAAGINLADILPPAQFIFLALLVVVVSAVTIEKATAKISVELVPDSESVLQTDSNSKSVGLFTLSMLGSLGFILEFLSRIGVPTDKLPFSQLIVIACIHFFIAFFISGFHMMILLTIDSELKSKLLYTCTFILRLSILVFSYYLVYSLYHVGIKWWIALIAGVFAGLVIGFVFRKVCPKADLPSNMELAIVAVISVAGIFLAYVIDTKVLPLVIWS